MVQYFKCDDALEYTTESLFETATTLEQIGNMVWGPSVWCCIPWSAVRSPSQHMHIVFTSERLVLLKLACTYATWNQKHKD